MAKIIGVEVSYSEIRYVYIRKRFRGFSILKKGRISTGGFSNLKDPEKLTFTIRQLIQQERLSPAKICLALSNDDFVIHQTTPPKMTEAELDKVVQGEIEDISKFSNLDFDYIYTASKRDEQSLRILFCALARPTLHSYIQAIQKTGLRLESLVVAPLNLLDLLYAQMPKDKTQALLVLDERASFIMIFSKDDCRLFFKMATGSEDLFVRGSLDKSAFLSWTGEMKRIIQSYQREFTAQPIEKIWFSWDNEKS
jgi:Tfp pilus assembly PilM family ATPase